MSKARVIFYYLLNNISLLANSVFLYYVAFLLMQREYGGVLCSIILGMDAFFEIVAGPWLARFIDTLSDLKMRLKRSLLLQFCLGSLSFLFTLLNISKPWLVILLLAVVRFLALIDTQLKSALPISLEKQGVLPLMQTLSLTLFSQRCILLISSTLALFFLNYSWFFSCSLNSLAYISAIAALLLILKFINSENLQKQAASLNPKIDKDTELTVNQKKKWVQWNYLLVFLLGISFGSVILILTKWMGLAANHSFFYQVCQGPAPIYGGMFLTLILILIYPIKFKPFTNNAKQICLICAIMAIGLLFSAFCPFYLRPVIFFILGILNGVSFVGGDTFFQRKAEGEDFVKAVAKNQAFGKAGALLSLFLVGICIDLHFSPLILLAVAGILGLLFCVILFLQASRLENPQEKEALIKESQEEASLIKETNS